MGRAEEAVVLRFAEAMVTRDVGAIAESFADDVVFHIPGRNSLTGDYRGKREVLTRLFQAWEEAFASLEIDVHDVLSTEDHVVLLADRKARRGDRVCEMRSSSVYHVRNGRIAEAWLMEWDPYSIDEFLS